MKIVVVEPHSDDAFLSIGWHLEHIWKGYDRTILTVFSDKRRGLEAVSYADAIGVGSVVIGLDESRMDSKAFPIKKVSKIQEYLDQLLDSEECQVVFPLGLQHPDHLRVAFSRPANCLRYIDTPYQTKLKLADNLSNLVRGRVIESIVYPPKRKWKHKDIYKSQSKFFHFNPLWDLKIPEIILK